MLTSIGAYAIDSAGKAITNFSINEGLSNNSITVIFQDNYGFLWIGTEDGLNRYDGYTFKTFRHSYSDANSIAGNHIQAIVQDDNNNLWIGTRDNGLSKLDYASGSFQSFQVDNSDQYALPENNVYGLLVDSLGRLWVKTKNYVSLYLGEEKGFKSFGHFNNVFNVKETTRFPLFPESDSLLLVGTKDGVNRLNINTGQFTRLKYEASGAICKDAVFDILQHDSNLFYIATSTGLKKLTTSSKGGEHFTELQKVTQNEAVNSLLLLQDDRLLAGTPGGVKIFDEVSGKFRPFKNYQGEELQFHVTTLHEDESGIIWVGSRYNGLFKINLTPPKFKSLTSESFQRKDIESVNIQSIYQDENDYLWLGTTTSGIYKYHPNSGELEHYSVNRELAETNSDAIYSLHKDESGRLWAGTRGGLFYFSSSSGKFVEFKGEGSANGPVRLLRSNKVYDLTNDFNGNLWVGTRFGLYRIEGSNVFSYFHDRHKDGGLYSDHINALATDEEGNVWIGTPSGLNCFDRESKRFLRVEFRNESQSKVNPSVLSLGLSYNGSILVGTRSGIWKVKSKEVIPQIISGNRLLNNDMIKAVVADATNRTWVSTNKGIACLNPDGTVYNFDEADGLPGYVFNKNSVFRNREGNLFFGGTEGLCLFHPDSIDYNLTLPEVAVTGISINRRGKKVISRWSAPEKFEIKYRPFSSVEFEFSALEFTQPSKNRYKVFFEGYDETWRPVTSDNKVSISNLLPGEYTLKILASNNDFIWNEDPFELDIVVSPPLWMSNYAFAFYLLALFFIIHLFINYRVRHYRKANKELQEKSVNKKQIEAQREVLTRINRSLTDSINYARRIQRAMIPSENDFLQIFPESFIYLRARDIVSGDFYWFHENENKVFVTAVDCTGHGVPGAFMSIIGIDLLKNIVEVHGVESPSEILGAMNEQLIQTLHREQPDGTSDNVKDGMDISLIVIDKKREVLEFSGAYNGFYLIRDNEIHTYKGDRFPIGYLKDGQLPFFTKTEVQLQKNDVLYLFSDGLADQFGGKENRKFKYRRFRLLLLNMHRLEFPDQKATLHQKIEEWMNGQNEQVDDILVMGLKPLG